MIIRHLDIPDELLRIYSFLDIQYVVSQKLHPTIIQRECDRSIKRNQC